MSFKAFRRTLVVTLLLAPMCALAEPSSAPTEAADKEARLQQRIKELEVTNKLLREQVGDLTRRNLLLQQQLEARMPRFRIFVPPPLARPFALPRVTPG